MQLLDFMKTENLSDEDLAGKIGGCSVHAIKKWKYRERTPSAAIIYKIRTVTKGLVSLEDWLPNSRVSVCHQITKEKFHNEPLP